MLMNRYDVEDAKERFAEDESDEFPNLAKGALILWRLMVWVDNHSDGWPYWAPPSRASRKMQDLLNQRLHRYDAVDCTDAELKAAISPIKAFLTRKDVPHEVVFPKERA